MVKRFLFSVKAGNWGKFGKEKNEGRFGKLFFQEFSQDSPDFLVDFTEKLKGTRKMDDGKEEWKTQFFMKTSSKDFLKRNKWKKKAFFPVFWGVAPFHKIKKKVR